MKKPIVTSVLIRDDVVVLSLKDSRLFGRCESSGLACSHDTNVPLHTVVIDGRALVFCSEKCAQDYYHESSGGTFNLFPDRPDALPQSTIEENLDYLRRP